MKLEPQELPALVSLAILIASSSVLNLKRGATGPNASSLVKTNHIGELTKNKNERKKERKERKEKSLASEN